MRLRPRARRPRSVPPVGVAHARAPRARPHHGHRGDDRAPRPGLRQQRRHGDRRADPAHALRIGRHRPPHLRASPATAASRRASATRRRRSPATSASASSSSSTTTTTSRSTATRTCRRATTSCQRFEAYHWHVEDLGEEANDVDALEAAVRRAMAVEDRPSLHRPAQPHRLAVAGVHRHRQGPRRPVPARGDRPHEGDPRPAARRVLLRPRRRGRGLPPAGRRARARRRGPSGRSASTPIATGDRAAWAACWAGTGLDGWEKDLPRFQLGEKLATRQAVQKAINATLPKLPGHRQRGRRPHRQHRHEARRRRDPVAPSTPAAASSTTASASTAWARR